MVIAEDSLNKGGSSRGKEKGIWELKSAELELMWGKKRGINVVQKNTTY